MTDIITEIKKHVKEGRLVLGKEKTMKLLRSGGLAKVFMASNCQQDLKDDLGHYASLADVELVEVPLSNEELGTLCKKPFFIAVMGLLKE
jgi:large subunit ribosomal protein L30e